jgi:cytochrome c556
VIWDDFAAFEQRANDLIEAMNNLATVAATGNQEETIRTAGTIGRTYCGGCHMQFRE